MADCALKNSFVVSVSLRKISLEFGVDANLTLTYIAKSPSKVISEPVPLAIVSILELPPKFNVPEASVYVGRLDSPIKCSVPI